jgi:(R,R)-butanediol dehydrogenase/meso-butanediol dehydrogenase/diacetyl reductase
MKAAIWYGKEDIRYEDYPEPVISNDDQVKIRVKCCGICGTDVHEYRDGPFMIPKRPHPLTGHCGGPLILGHEYSGDVVEVGGGVTKVKVAHRVTVNPLIYCGECHYCRRGEHNMCLRLATQGLAYNGAFAEYTVVDERMIVPLPNGMSYEQGAFAEPMAVAVRAVRRSGITVGDSVAIVGAGPIGLLVMQVCLAAGASQVFVVEPMKARRGLAENLGAAAVFDPGQTDPGKDIARLTDGLRADIAFDCVGNQPAFDTAVKVTGRRGMICVVGLSLKPIEAPFIRLWGHEKEITFSSGYEDEFPAAIAILADKRVNVEALISARIKLDGLVEKGIKQIMEKPDNYVKILVYP